MDMATQVRVECLIKWGLIGGNATSNGKDGGFGGGGATRGLLLQRRRGWRGIFRRRRLRY